MPKILRKEHKKYVKTMINNYETISLEKNIDFEEIYRQWQQFGEIIKSSNHQKKSINNPGKHVLYVCHLIK
ncbi:hypothetical protein [Bacillus methanolicus]|uniref:hypothetical protein n=1 Tax=Bacillus methanolicus TaxID=1471 RepID=UPI00025F26B8|nr:hypothetical protein [Bacillus methanolicus]EIJ80999.1 hypothetical protein MGA3_11940 [Bacillus methanolicus MGA3]